jgi:Subtilase family
MLSTPSRFPYHRHRDALPALGFVQALSGVDPIVDPGDLYDQGGGTGTSFSAPAVSGLVALRIANGQCAGLTPREIVAKIVEDAATYNAENTGYGYEGDPLRPITGEYYGYLLSLAVLNRWHCVAFWKSSARKEIGSAVNKGSAIIPDATKEEIEQGMDERARCYARMPRGDPQRAEIAKELSELCLMLDRLAATVH